MLEYYGEKDAYGDAVLFAKAALLDTDVDSLISKQEKK
jgi:hypothetical protein